MQLNTTAALTTALISAVIGFGVAFYLGRKITRNAPTKAQKILATVAMASLGYGLTAFFNEVIGFPLQGLQIRYDKLVGYFIANIVVLPVIFLGIAKLIGLKYKSAPIAFSDRPNEAAHSALKYFLIAIVAVVIGYIGYVALEGNSSAATYDFYPKVDYKNCSSEYEKKPLMSSKFLYKKETNEIFMTSDFEVDGVKKQQIKKLENCSVLDSKNWTCGGDWLASTKKPTYMFVDGVFIYEGYVFPDTPNCPYKIVKR